MYSIIRDDDMVLQIDAASRQISVPSGCNVIGAAGDHSSEQLTIQCPRYMDGHDLAGCAMKWISWQNARGDFGENQIVGIIYDTETIQFTWTTSAPLMVAAGLISFSVHFADLDSEGRVIYMWSTGICKDLRVLESLGNRLEYGVALETDGSGITQVEVDDGKLNAAVYSAVRKVLYG